MNNIVNRIKAKALLKRASVIRRMKYPQKYKPLSFWMDYLSKEDVRPNDAAKKNQKTVISEFVTLNSWHFPKKCACLVYRNPIYRDEANFEKYADTAIQKGAAVLITNQPYKNYPCLVSNNPFETYAKFCRYFRDLRNDISITTVTGSIGKSTVKGMIGCVYETKYKAEYTDANVNSLKAVGFTVQHIPDDLEILVQEIAESEPGETQYLTEMLHPDVFVITAIDSSHLEHFGSVEKIVEEICSATKNITEDGIVIVNKDEFSRFDLLNGKRTVTVSLADPNADFYADNIVMDAQGLSFIVSMKSNGCRFDVRLNNIFARHNVYCALYAFAAGCFKGVEPENIVRGLANYRTKGTRQNVLMTNDGVVLYADCYNAIAKSMKSAMDACDEIPVVGKRVAVLGDVEEVGDVSESMHQDIIKHVNESKFDTLFTKGDKMRKAVEASLIRDSLKTKCFDTIEELSNALKETISKGDLVLFKSSHSGNLDKCISNVWPELKDVIVSDADIVFNEWKSKSLFY